MGALRRWFVAQTQPNSEARAVKFLTSADFDCQTVYFPRILQRRAHAGRVDFVPRPFLPRYLFVLDEGQGIRPVRYAPGISHVVLQPSGPVFVYDAALDLIRSREKDGYVQLEPSMRPNYFRRDDPVIVEMDGGDLRALFQHQSGSHRAVVFANLLGKLTRVSVPLASVRKAPPAMRVMKLPKVKGKRRVPAQTVESSMAEPSSG